MLRFDVAGGQVGSKLRRRKGEQSGMGAVRRADPWVVAALQVASGAHPAAGEVRGQACLVQD